MAAIVTFILTSQGEKKTDCFATVFMRVKGVRMQGI